jgi:hypothetical protein
MECQGAKYHYPEKENHLKDLRNQIQQRVKSMAGQVFATGRVGKFFQKYDLFRLFERWLTWKGISWFNGWHVVQYAM